MSAVYLLTGRLGSGKSLAAVSQAVDYASKGRRVVSNFFIDLAPASTRSGSKLAKAFVEIIPSRPLVKDLLALGRGGEGEHDAGLLILDECATFLNARQWNGDGRQDLIEWFLHSRKLGWDIIFIVQHQSMLDKQVREALCEFLVTVRRMDKMSIPVISWIFPIKFPQIHVAQVRYGLGPNDVTADKWVFRGRNLYACYDTKWISEAGEQGSYCTLPADLSKFRYAGKSQWPFYRSLLWRIPLYYIGQLYVRVGAIRADQGFAGVVPRSSVVV